MCLNTLDNSLIPKEKVVFAWKLFKKYKKGGFLKGAVQNNLVKRGVWMQRSGGFSLGDDQDDNRYPVGFHGLVFKKDALALKRKYYGTGYAYCTITVVRVKLKKILAAGRGDGLMSDAAPCYVAEYMLVPRARKVKK